MSEVEGYFGCECCGAQFVTPEQHHCLGNLEAEVSRLRAALEHIALNAEDKTELGVAWLGRFAARALAARSEIGGRDGA